jgi:outer membrane scaffolding protein for murein synthesis (MipA/OmpV family)
VAAGFFLPRALRLICCGLTLFLPATPALAEQKPLWEAGAGITALDFPHYRGANERKAWVLPFPYFVYRGDFLQVDERRMRGVFFRGDDVDLDFSANGAVPVESSENEARRGMPDLDGTVEIGPSLNFFPLRSGDRKSHLELRLPLRAVIATDFSRFRAAGWVFQPNLNFDIHNVFGGWKFGLQGGVVFSDRRYHQYYYAVQPEFATPSRPAFSAPGGYTGTQITAALSKRYPRFWVGGFARWDRLNGSAFEDSPLVKQKQNFTAGFAVAWILRESGTTVDTRD